MAVPLCDARVLGVPAVEVSHYGMALRKFEVMIWVVDGWYFAYGVDLQVLLGLVLVQGHPGLHYLVRNTADEEHREYCPGGL